jgi:gamma-glutamylcyclotransferase (GGCT)/AIG2-like uncharacterized protein YtfP
VKSSEGPRHLFAYGTLVDPHCLEGVLGHKHEGERVAARLQGYQRVSDPGYPYPFIVEAQGSWVDGILVMDLSPYDLQVLDQYEEVDSGVYRREPVQVDAWGCGPHPMRLHADAYVAGAALRPSTSR